MSKKFKESKSAVANGSNSTTESPLQEIIIPTNSNLDHNLDYQNTVDTLLDHSDDDDNINNRNEISSDLTALELSEVDASIPQDLPVGNTNSFAINKGIAEGMMDIALLTANANQLRFLITYNKNSNTYTLLVALIITSLIIQIAVGVALIFKHQMKVRGEPYNTRTYDFIVSGIFLVTVINVFAAAFTTTETSNLNTTPSALSSSSSTSSSTSSLSTLSN